MMNSSPFLSIVTASFNNLHTIKKTLNSVINQYFTNCEHIVIDGGSVDGTKDVIQCYGKRNNVKFISEPDDGIADALNKGLKLSKGKYILVLHADDRLLNAEVLKNVSSIIKSEKYDIYGFPIFVDDPGGTTRPFKPFPLHWWHHFKTIIPHQGAFVHRRVYEKIGGYRTDFSIAMDYDFFYRAFNAKCSLKLEREFVAVMGGCGISNNKALLQRRLNEEALVYRINEKNPLWRMAQIIFRLLYVPYKTRLWVKKSL